ncbi:hypothetical protein TSUD_405400 [Trifolium subterraneum]|uniref:Reverse transcriptase domain-containing protein n=1 Tax=Trifolium subterraneum TaxID=3900 RepID=A0A2Z6PFE1_TRISU|nr:hypothetical protein TSUD_405400 [Trifolium subterraneum]
MLDVVFRATKSTSYTSLSFAEGDSLVKPFSVEEVKAVIWDCDSYKSPGPDGVNFGFLKEFWAEMQVDIMRFITEFHRNDKLSKEFWAEMQVDIMRFITEFHRNDKLSKGINSKFITLIAKCYFGDSDIVCQEQTDSRWDEARKTHKELLLFKVDFEKAYDSVDWWYLDTVMGKMSFPMLWQKWISECVCTATASVLVNGSPIEEFPMERGLRQGDPLSPFLFLLATKGLNVMMRAMVQANLYTGYNIGSENSTVVSHLLFADDTLLLGNKSWANARVLRGVLSLFEKVSVLKVNFHKSMLVGVNIGASWLTEVASMLDCKVGKVPFMYLGMPIGGDPRRLSFWEPIVSSIHTRLSRWKNHFLSFGSRLILLKSVVTCLPLYALSFFKALSGAWWTGSYIVEEVQHRFVRRVGDGDDTFFWSNPWLGGVPLCVRYRHLLDLATNQSISVAEMCALGWEEGGAGWQWRRHLWVWAEKLLAECRGLLLDIALQTNISDSWIWQTDIGGGYSVRDAYSRFTALADGTTTGASDLIWHKQVPLKVSVLAWRLLRNKLLGGAQYYSS